MKILGIDLETTGIDVTTSNIIELGAVLWDTDHKSPVKILSELIYEPCYESLTKEIIALTGITDEILKRYGENPIDALKKFFKLYSEADYIMAHNGNLFDRPLLFNFISVYFGEMELKDLCVVDKHWIDTLTDIEYPKHIETRKQSYLAAEHGFLNPFQHRAVTDVLTMFKIFNFYDLKRIIEISKSHIIRFVSLAGFESKDLVKAAGFKWNKFPETHYKSWTKDVKEAVLDKDWKEKKLFEFQYEYFEQK